MVFKLIVALTFLTAVFAAVNNLIQRATLDDLLNMNSNDKVPQQAIATSPRPIADNNVGFGIFHLFFFINIMVIGVFYF